MIIHHLALIAGAIVFLSSSPNDITAKIVSIDCVKKNRGYEYIVSTEVYNKNKKSIFFLISSPSIMVNENTTLREKSVQLKVFEVDDGWNTPHFVVGKFIEIKAGQKINFKHKVYAEVKYVMFDITYKYIFDRRKYESINDRITREKYLEILSRFTHEITLSYSMTQ